tara:strand:+ start:7234 stop:7449 length:216 start_codon:yes stop_codon:yes gene_type:complete
MNFKTIKDRLAEALTEKGYSYSDAQLEYVLDCENWDGIPFRMCSKTYIPLMFAEFTRLNALSPMKSDFRLL